MLPQQIKYRLWHMALRMNPQPAVLSARAGIAADSASTDDGADGFTKYNLLRVTYTDELTSAELAAQNATIADVWRVWLVYQVDLDQAGASQPAPLQMLTFGDGTSWIIERVSGTAMNQCWRCLSRQSH